MVIANSESNTTLVSLSDEKHRIPNHSIVLGKSGLLQFTQPATTATPPPCHTYGGVATKLLIPAPDCLGSEDKHVPLYLPAADALEDVDEYLACDYYGINSNDRTNNLEPDMRTGAESLRQSRRRLLSTPLRRIGENEQERVLYIAQGERANATSKEYDVLVSDKATTCHILAFRSRTTSDDDMSLTSLTHLDGPNYEGCVRDMIQEHIDHHRERRHLSTRALFVEEEKKSDDCYETNANETVTIDVHVMGGFFDRDMASSDITEWLTHMLARLAEELSGVRMVVKTLVVSSSNNQVDDRNNDSPIGRGLGIDARTGDVFLAQCDGGNSSGPVPLVRSVRLWSRTDGSSVPHKLSVVHTVRDLDDLFSSFNINQDDGIRSEFSFFWVQPFMLRLIPYADALLRLPNKLLLQQTSTSPEVEEPGFCDDVRASLWFLRQRCNVERDDGSTMFGTNFDRPMVFAMRHTNASGRSDASQGEWKQLSL
mmetsp:Transcript_10366/g.30309  ORF Transcript_10366/g.30309 Transcript_10366/m.30309 type:complete len:483 (-) Transcript_10366:176-1624(-)|eukprot:CAMPEP_0172369014 /NCGR_PEP_ID=MMETSP1060-20121228/30176_1 /TAXON_ID=37318 /ORGANISM="Pseudo-nitzschia pungens, Strain cf. cingulata" /LENGTH=482 /DNA_ID=CAMNT_0013093785 /DNA_START=71 /DNA_END=1519 /DNA_ORIENTATION=+